MFILAIIASVITGSVFFFFVYIMNQKWSYINELQTILYKKKSYFSNILQKEKKKYCIYI